MKALIDLDTLSHSYRIFDTREDYNNCTHSWSGWSNTWKEGMYLARYRNEPTPNAKFPILVIEAGWGYNPNGPDEIENIIFDADQFTLIED